MPNKLIMAIGLMLLAAVPSSRGQSSSGTLVGLITDSDGRGLPGVTVSAISGCDCADCSDPKTCDCCPDQVPLVVVSNAEGRFRLMGLPRGKYNIQVSLEGYQTQNTAVSIQMGRSTSVEIQLQKDPIDVEVER